MGNTTAQYRWFAIFYLINMFFVAPGLVFGLSMGGLPGTIVLGIVVVSVILLLISAAIISILQKKCPTKLPKKLRDWEFVSHILLDPLDKLISKLLSILKKCCPSCCNKDTEEKMADSNMEVDTHDAIQVARQLLDVSDKTENIELWETESGYGSSKVTPSASCATSVDLGPRVEAPLGHLRM